MGNVNISPQPIPPHLTPLFNVYVCQCSCAILALEVPGEGNIPPHPTLCSTMFNDVQRVCASVCAPFLLCKCQTSHPIPPLVQGVHVTSHPSPCATCMCASICAPFMVLQTPTNYTTFRLANVEAYDPMGKIDMMDLHECTCQGRIVLRAVFKNVV